MNLPAGYEVDTVLRLETNLDDLSSEILGSVMEKLLKAGALDVWFVPVQMKKNRPGVMLCALATEETVGVLAEIVLSETTAFGLRLEKVMRLKLGRHFETVATEFGEIVVKVGTRGGTVVQASPEYESCRQASAASGAPLKDVYRAAEHAWRVTRVS